ncbi:vWA domain-containing protein [Parahaliea mediterranea]|uniref:VWA domain-containing protein n=1 Tax=Parahaliea mediterranea TaxID=651086 RepID=A0A939DGL8_9GAMM|nr:VWA domain-containing protein [Parahaliea mediterranea]MBN7797854.1 VWA domain-containing protein [Parahaliea mediterranea]
MLELVHPWALALLPLPLLMRWLPAHREQRDSVKVPFFQTLLALSGERPREGAQVLRRRRLQTLLVASMWLALVAAASKPEWVGEPIEQQREGRDLMVAVDLSGSMETRDFTLPDGERVDRLEAVKYVLDRLARQRDSDRLGLIVFGSAAFLQTPFTPDQNVWSQLLAETRIGMAGQSTVFGDAIGLAIKLFLDSGSEHRVLVVLTDGNDTGSRVPPVDAARVAATEGIRIYPIAVGDPAAVGEDALDMQTLERVAQLTGGRAFQALDRASLEAASRTIAALEPALYETVSFRPRHSLHWLPVAAVSLLYGSYHGWAALLVWRQHRRQRGPARAA